MRHGELIDVGSAVQAPENAPQTDLEFVMSTVICEKGVYHFEEVCGSFYNGVYQAPPVLQLCMCGFNESDMALVDIQGILGVAKEPPPPPPPPGVVPGRWSLSV